MDSQPRSVAAKSWRPFISDSGSGDRGSNPRGAIFKFNSEKVYQYFIDRFLNIIEKFINYNMLTIVHMTQMMTKRIPVSEDMWRQLGRIKEAGQTYDDLLGELLQAFNRKELARFAGAARKREGNWHRLEDA